MEEKVDALSCVYIFEFKLRLQTYVQPARSESHIIQINAFGE
jgi:hypothetical protein